jgi:nucleotide-binding universal stress UspA family protein
VSTDRNQVLAAAGRGPAARAVAAYAAREAAVRGSVLRLVHVIPPDLPLSPRPLLRKDSLQSVGAATLEQAAAEAAEASPGVPIAVSLISGPRAESLLADAESAALLVLGASGAAGGTGLWPGSLVTAVAMSAPCPVVVVPHGEEDETSVRTVVVGVRWPPHADELLLEEAFAAAQRWGCGLEVLHASTRQDPGRLPGLRALIEERVQVFRRAHPQVAVHVDVVRSTSDEALAAAATPGAVVMISRARGWARGRLLGPTTRGLLHHAHCPVEIVPPAAERPSEPRRTLTTAASR